MKILLVDFEVLNVVFDGYFFKSREKRVGGLDGIYGMKYIIIFVMVLRDYFRYRF